MKPFFRAWWPERGVMLYPPPSTSSFTACYPSTHIQFPDTSLPDIDGTNTMVDIELHAFMTWDGRYYINGKHIDLTWLQYTGMRDISGKRIYNGDILRVLVPGWYTSVFMDEIRGTWRVKPIIGKSITERELWSVAWEYHNLSLVVGNIYENPELIEKIGHPVPKELTWDGTRPEERIRDCD